MRFSWALWEPQRGVDDGPRENFAAVILHTAVTKAETLNLPDSNRPGVGCHGYIDQAGKFHQYLDTDRYTGHAWDANHWAIGIETWDNGDPDHTPWNQAQLDTIDRILRDLKIPAQSLKEQRSEGVGYHRQYNSWNQSNHSCPTDTRIAQVPGIIARLAKGEGFMAGLSDADQQKVLTGAQRSWGALTGVADAFGIAHPPSMEKDDGVLNKGWANEAMRKLVELLQGP